MVDKDIIQELNDLGSSLAAFDRKNVYSAPEGYFEFFEARLQSLAWLSSLPKETPYSIPTVYFDTLPEQIMETIRSHADYQTSEEELATLSPLLTSINKRPVYSVPEGYFENFKPATVKEQKGASVIPLAQRSWFRYAAAAVVTGVIALSGLMIYNNSGSKPSDSAGKAPLAKFEKEVKKIDDVKSTEKLIDIMDAGLNEKELASNNKTIKTEDVQQLLKDVPTEELREFNEQTKDIEDVMMTN